ncbi:MAG: ComF family protein [Bacteroidales bacterium]|nr:ComF family protein [Bacteroidales bacterium]
MNKFIRKTKGILEDVFGLFFPNTCMGCGRPLYRGEAVICSLCHFHLPKTYFHNDPDNPLNKAFWGRVNLEMAAAYLYFQKGGVVQHLLHQLKYQDHPEIGITIGKWYGKELNWASEFRYADLIIPVPLHRRKLRKRGYNQSQMFAEGLAAVMKAGTDTGCLYRKVHSQTQTRKARYNRWENVENIFALRNGHKLEGKHILLVDDVVTTGATLESCAQALLTVPGVKISVATIAFASS